jgi:hypothetical protein
MAAILQADRYVRRYELIAWTGYGTHSVSSAIRRLSDLGLIVGRTSRGPWRARDEDELPPAGAKLSIARRPRMSPAPPSSSPSSIEEVSKDREEEEEQGADFAQSYRALMRAGIREPAASQLARLPHVNPAYIAAHVEAALNSEHGLGMAIYRMRYGWPAPERRAAARREQDSVKRRQAEVAEMIRRFLE